MRALTGTLCSPAVREGDRAAHEDHLRLQATQVFHILLGHSMYARKQASVTRLLIMFPLGLDRMPTHLGNFISETVYKSTLKSEHAIKDRKCVAFVDVRKGKEESVSSSWKV